MRRDFDIDRNLIRGSFRPVVGSPATSAGWIRKRLEENEVRLHRGSRLDNALESLLVFDHKLRSGRLHREPLVASSACEPFNTYAQWIGAELLTKAVHRGELRGLRFNRDRWQALAAADPIITRPFKGNPQKGRAITLETVIGSICATFSKDVRFDIAETTHRSLLRAPSTMVQ